LAKNKLKELETEKALVGKILGARNRGETKITKAELVEGFGLSNSTIRRRIEMIGSEGSHIIETDKATRGAVYPIDFSWTDEELDLYISSPPHNFNE